MRFWNNSAFEKQIRNLARESESVRFTFHAQSRMEQRAITVPMVLECLRRGVIRRPPEQNIKTAGMNAGSNVTRRARMWRWSQPSLKAIRPSSSSP